MFSIENILFVFSHHPHNPNVPQSPNVSHRIPESPPFPSGYPHTHPHRSRRVPTFRTVLHSENLQTVRDYGNSWYHSNREPVCNDHNHLKAFFLRGTIRKAFNFFETFGPRGTITIISKVRSYHFNLCCTHF